jgi:hypothetical protein
MLRANVGLSRKISRDFNSTGYSINIEGELIVSLDDPEAVLQRIKELWAVAEESLALEMERDQGELLTDLRNGVPVRHEQQEHFSVAPPKVVPPAHSPDPKNSHSSSNLATPNQLQFIQNLAKREKLSPVELESIITRTLGRPTTLSHLPKKDAGAVIEALKGKEPKKN